jgi:hypothetical protein
LSLYQAASYAQYIYQLSVNDPKFPPEWPDIYSSDLIDKRLLKVIEYLIVQTLEECDELQSRIMVQQSACRQNQRLNPVTTSNPPSPTPSIESVGSLGLSSARISGQDTSNFSITTATITEFPHIFITVLYSLLGRMESWKLEDLQLLPTSQTKANQTWVYNFLSDLLEWQSLKRQQRTALVNGITKVINEKKTPFDSRQLSSRFGPNSVGKIKAFVKQAQKEIKDGVFQSPSFLVKYQSRLFSIVPCPGYTRKYMLYIFIIYSITPLLNASC